MIKSNYQYEKITNIWLTLFVIIQHGCESQASYEELDAFDYSLCGKAKYQEWQTRQRGFDCPRSSNRSFCQEEEEEERHQETDSGHKERGKHRMSFGVNVKPGEFPSQAQLIWRYDRAVYGCGGTLIHKDLIITAGHCVPRRGSYGRGQAILGTTWRLNSRRDGVVVPVERWCRLREFYMIGQAPYYDVGLVKLRYPVTYGPNIQPACLDLTRRHRDNTNCVIVGTGKISEAERYAAKVQAMPMRRIRQSWREMPDTSSYMSASREWAGNPCPGDSGSPLYCYDTCTPGTTKTFVVAAVSSGPFNSCIRGRRVALNFADFNKLRSKIEAMMRSCLDWRTKRAFQASNTTSCLD